MMNALDASVLFGAVFEKGAGYEIANRALYGLSGPVCTTEACLTEAMYLAGNRVGWQAQERLWTLTDIYRIEIESPDIALVQNLMRRYKDVPMDFADATLVALASEEPQVRIATFDSDFVAYRRDDGSPVPLVGERLLGWE